MQTTTTTTTSPVVPKSNQLVTIPKKNDMVSLHLINFKIIDKELKKKNEFYNACIIQYFSIAQEVMDSVAKIYLYQMQQQSIGGINECFEKYENSNILKLSKDVKDLKIDSFDNYENLKSQRLYPEIGYSLFYIKKDKSKIALIKIYKTFFGYPTSSIMVKWKIVKVTI